MVSYLSSSFNQTKNSLKNTFRTIRSSSQNFLAITLCLGISSCSVTEKYFPDIPKIASPEIEEVIDLGGLPIVPSEKGKVDESHSDNVFTPGEWIAIKGKYLSNSNIHIDNTPITIHYELNRHKRKGVRTLVAKIPTGLKKFTSHQLTVSSPHGKDSFEFNTQHYIVGSDPKGNTLQLLKTNVNVKGFIEPRRQKIEQENPLFTQFHPDGNLLYSIGFSPKKGAKPDQIHLNTIHLAESPQPVSVASTFIEASSPPTNVSLQDNWLLIVTQKGWLIFDIENALEPLLITQHSIETVLNKKAAHLIDGALLKNHHSLLLLDSYNNRLILVDISKPNSPQASKVISLFPSAKEPVVIDLVTSQTSDNQFWIIGGRNVHKHQRIPKITNYRKMFSIDPNTKESLTRYQAFSKILPVEVENGQLKLNPQIDLPEHHLPLFGAEDEENLYLSTIDIGFFGNGGFSDKSLFRHVSQLLYQDFQVGNILKIHKSSGDHEIIAKGIHIPYNLQYDPELGLVYTQLKMSNMKAFPHVRVEWGMKIQIRGSYGLRNENHKHLFPPYSLGEIAIQN